MILQDMTFPDSFFEDEVRDGFFIPSMMKRNWACQLEILRVIDTICNRHGIRWYIDSGTLLGAVRHHGFIPWDDDIDIIMRRSDQRRFIEAAQTELPSGFILKNPETDDDATNSNIMLFNSDMIDTSFERMEHFHGFPYGVCVDIFTLDGVAPDHAEHEKIHERIDPIREAITHLKNKRGDTKEFRTLISRIEQENGTALFASKHLEGDLWRLMVKHHMTISDVSAGQYEFYWGKNDRLIFDAESYAQTVMLPFEFLELPAPVGYEEVLRTVYGDYHIVHRGGAHSYPVFAGQERKLAKEIGCHPFRYTMTAENVLAERTATPLQQAEAEFDVMKRVCLSLQTVAADENAVRKLLLAMQNLVAGLIELFTPILTPLRMPSDTVAEKTESAGKLALLKLQELSVSIFDAFEDWNDEKALTINHEMTAAKELLLRAYTDRNEIVFLVARPTWWSQMESVWQLFQNETIMECSQDNRTCHEATEDDVPQNTKMYCLRQPLYRKSLKEPRGERIYADEICESMPVCMDADVYDFAARHPSKIVIQFPFDGTGTALTTDETCFSYHLKNCTDELIYVPCFSPQAVEEKDDVLVKAMRYLVEQPAVAFADKVIVSDDRIRSVYREILNDITGAEMYALWDKKIVTTKTLLETKGDENETA